MGVAVEWMSVAGFLLLFVPLFIAFLHVFRNLWRDGEWEANERPDDRAWNEHFHRVLFVMGAPGGRLGKVLNASMAGGTALVLLAGLLKLIELLLPRAGQ